jgi:Poly(ADP-ribose) polymerase and DNA-Ligase Zn-finger region
MPDRLEIAASGRARCRACRGSIAKGEERFAEAAPNPAAEGESQHYYHLRCAAERRPKTFSALLTSLEPARSDLAELGASTALALAHHRLERLGVLERAKSARANCRQCREPIEKDGWRVALQPMEDGRLGAWGFLHLSCVANYAGIKPTLDRLTHYSELSADDKADIATKLEALPEPEPAPAPNEETPASQLPSELVDERE